MICRAIPYEGQESYIFVSYCHKDKAKLYPMIEQMALDGYRIWYDDGNHAGDDWLDNIENHLEDCKVVVAFISDNSSLSHNCKSEIVYAIKCKKKIIPVLIESTDLPKGLRMQLSHLHYLESADYTSEKALLNKIYEAEECKACKGPAGSLQLKSALSQMPAPDPGRSKIKKKNSIIAGLNTINPHHKKVSASKVESDPAFDKYGESPKKKRLIKITGIIHKKDEEVTNEADPKSLIIAGDPVRIPNEKNQDKRAPIDSDSVVGDEENTVVQKYDIDNENTVYQGNNGDETVRQRYSVGLDDDVTVRASSRNLALLLHPANQRSYTIRKPQTKIGRSPIKCDVVIEGNDSISKQHAEIRQANQKYFLIDSNSANGTYIKGEPLEAGKQVLLDNPASFQLNDETLILVSGIQARKIIAKGSVALLLTENGASVRLMDGDTLALNRNNKWPDGTLSDSKIHRVAHAKLRQKEDGIYLVDESPECGNGTYLNGTRLKSDDSQLLTSGDQIRLGDTTLEFVSITI